jgi:phage/plasmid-like protein (TIGR03299 family)
MANGKHLVFNGKEAPWHRLGTPFDVADKLTAVEALVLASTDYTVHKLPTFTRLPDGSIRLSSQYAMWREPIRSDDDEWREFGTVSEKYVPLQNRELAELVDSLGITETWPVETHGALGAGERVFFCFDAGPFTVKGEECRQFLSLLDDKRGMAALKMTVSAVRVVCCNTWQANEASANITASIPHTGTIKDETALRLQLVRGVQRAQSELREACEHIAKTPVSAALVDTYTKSLYPDPVMPRKLQLAQTLTPDDIGAKIWQEIAGKSPIEAKEAYDNLCVLAQAHREGVKQQFARVNDEFPGIANSGWSLFNGFTQWVDHEAPRRGSDSLARMESLAFGEQATLKARAFTEILELAK